MTGFYPHGRIQRKARVPLLCYFNHLVILVVFFDRIENICCKIPICLKSTLKVRRVKSILCVSIVAHYCPCPIKIFNGMMDHFSIYLEKVKLSEMYYFNKPRNLFIFASIPLLYLFEFVVNVRYWCIFILWHTHPYML